MANEENLIKPKRDRTAKQRRESASKAGKASAAKKRERKAMQELAKIILNTPVEGKPEELDDIEAMCFEDFPDKHLTVGERSLFAVAKKAQKGDIAAITFLRDTAGEKPVEKLEVSGDVEKAAANIQAMIAAEKEKG